ncbi:hypothetical protein MUK70_29845 [Dyadobacter chenwenxiniae]|uniref:Uncharacterized protein n=1 Tax=Dyadobacter chenwenxiniae TaxID=2906456 RepID=A0A9X1PP04_9BACT|nr:hypothetical protein [Dyadobacter chenwenxiniae]MCF0049794.1 hypothetical protein [Dyadobacter chenwenxiniae]MCF0049872.1 hypothetical protein [Dyadobacter chenwenxiniae]MCF0063524.1 hypothetical protein [Dyadobacter chenwenxiniae]UON83203.1 hypothetical protein MUK70_29845 [Dyadobacter chenwenxiniae]
MESILINPRNSEELKLLSDFLEKSNITSKILSEEQLEDAGLTMLMRETDRSQKVSREEIMQKLKIIES